MRMQPSGISFRRPLLAAFALVLGVAAGPSVAEPWSFGVISDTQWTKADDGKNPNTCAADIIHQVDQQFIAKKVKLVVHVGDMVDSGSQKNDYTRALYAQELYNAGIGFYPLRGNHEAAHGSYTGSGADFLYAYPQIEPGRHAGWNNATPGDITKALIPNADLNPFSGNPPADQIRAWPFKVGTDFSAPEAVNAQTGGVSYAFQYRNATFLLLDQFKSPDYYTSYIPEQQYWIDATLSNRPRYTHAFVFTHKNVLGGNHKDNMFGGQVNNNDPGDGYYLCDSTKKPSTEGDTCAIDPGTSIPTTADFTLRDKQDAESTFLASLQKYDVKYMISGHDHHHYNSVVTSSDGLSKVHQLITQSDSSKFYTPELPVSPNDTPVEQELREIGYYIFTVEGPRVTIDYYADTHPDWTGKSPVTTPKLNFVKRSTTGYSLNGTETLIAQGDSYAQIRDDTTKAARMDHGFRGTAMAILDGTNGSTAETNYGRKMEKAVNTGWAPAGPGLVSDILTLWGMADLGTDQTDTYVLAMSFNHRVPWPLFANGRLVILTRNDRGQWLNAVDANFGGSRKFVRGPWMPQYDLGTFGIDPSSGVAWAVLNHGGEFAVAPDIGPWQGLRR